MKRARMNTSNGDTLGLEAMPWQTADALRNNMDAAEYKHVVLGLIFLKYISDAFKLRTQRLTATLREQCAESARLDREIWKNLEKLGYGK